MERIIKKKGIFIIRVIPGGGFFIFFIILYNFQKIKKTNKIPFVDLKVYTKYNESSKINNTYNSWNIILRTSHYKLKDIYKTKNVFFT